LLEYHARYDDPASGQFITPDSSVVGAGPLTVWPSDATAQGMGRSAGSGPVNPQDLNRSADALNHPLTYTDPTGHWVETAWDLANLVLSAAAVWQHPSDPWNWAALAADTASTVLPVVPGGGGALIRAAAHADEAAGAAQAAARGGGVVAAAVPQAGQLHKNANDVTKRPSGFRKGVREAVESKATRNEEGEMICPTCGRTMTKPDLDHTPPWRDRVARMFGWTRKQVLDEYNDVTKLRAQCPSCNRSRKFEQGASYE